MYIPSIKTSTQVLQRLLDTNQEPLQCGGWWPFMMCMLCLWLYMESTAYSEAYGTGCMPYYKAKQNSEDCEIGYNSHFPLSDSTWAWKFEEDLFLTICFYSVMWPGIAFLFFLSLALIRRGCFEFFIALGAALQGLPVEWIKKAVPCADMEHYYEPICQWWIRPPTSCLDDCGMFSGHTCVAYFFLGWGISYIYEFNKVCSHYDQRELQPLLTPQPAERHPRFAITRFSRKIKIPHAFTNVSAIIAGTFLLLQTPMKWILGDHNAFQIFIGAMFGLAEGWIWYRYIATPERVRGFCATPIGKFMGFYDNYSFPLSYIKKSDDKPSKKVYYTSIPSVPYFSIDKIPGSEISSSEECENEV